MQVGALYNLDSQAAIGNEVLHSNEKLLAKLSGVSPNVAQPTEAQAHFLEELKGTSLIGKISRGDQDSEDKSRGIHDHMPLSSHKFLSSIKETPEKGKPSSKPELRRLGKLGEISKKGIDRAGELIVLLRS